MTDFDQIKRDIEALVLQVAEGTFTRADLMAAGGSLEKVGLSSVKYMALIEAMEHRFGITVDPETDPEFLESIDTLAIFVVSQFQSSQGAASLAAGS
jgi:acyl carrier protein